MLVCKARGQQAELCGRMHGCRLKYNALLERDGLDETQWHSWWHQSAACSVVCWATIDYEQAIIVQEHTAPRYMWQSTFTGCVMAAELLPALRKCALTAYCAAWVAINMS